MLKELEESSAVKNCDYLIFHLSQKRRRGGLQSLCIVSKRINLARPELIPLAVEAPVHIFLSRSPRRPVVVSTSRTLLETSYTSFRLTTCVIKPWVTATHTSGHFFWRCKLVQKFVYDAVIQLNQFCDVSRTFEKLCIAQFRFLYR